MSFKYLKTVYNSFFNYQTKTFEHDNNPWKKCFSLVLDEIKNIKIIQGETLRNKYNLFDLVFNDRFNLNSATYAFFGVKNTLCTDFFKIEPPNKNYCVKGKHLKAMLASEYKIAAMGINGLAIKLADIVGFYIDEFSRLFYILNLKTFERSYHRFCRLKGAKSFYILNIKTKKCSCLGYKYHGNCKHQYQAEQEQEQIKLRTQIILKEKLGNEIAQQIGFEMDIF